MSTFDELIAKLDSGQTNSEITREVRDMLAALNERAQNSGSAKGKLTLTLDFAVANNGRVEIQASTKIQRPGPPKTKETRWIGPKGELLAADPRQSGFAFKVAGAGDRTEPPKVPGAGDRPEPPKVPGKN